jgi:hypothetical protein
MSLSQLLFLDTLVNCFFIVIFIFFIIYAVSEELPRTPVLNLNKRLKILITNICKRYWFLDFNKVTNKAFSYLVML